MLQTIVTSSHISVQGEYVETLADGRVVVRTGKSLHVGRRIMALREHLTSTENRLAEAR